jgi:hypothetical protein
MQMVPKSVLPTWTCPRKDMITSMNQRSQLSEREQGPSPFHSMTHSECVIRVSPRRSTSCAMRKSSDHVSLHRRGSSSLQPVMVAAANSSG